MSIHGLNQKKARQEQELRIQRQIAFASGLFQGDVTVRTLLESLIEGVVIIDNSGTILLVNAAAEQMFGYQRKELIGKPQTVLIPERFRKVHEEHQASYFAEPGIKPVDLLLDLAGRRRDGSEFPVEISLSYIETINGILVMGLVSDITLRKQFETRLRESEEQFHIQVEGVKDYAIFMIDTQGNVLNWNAGAERLKGYRADEIIGTHFSCFYPEGERNAGKPEEDLKKAAVEGRLVDEGWRIRKDGSSFWAAVIITAQFDESGNLRGFSKVTHDISGRKKAEDALRFSEARYRALFRDNPTMIVTLDADLTMLSANLVCTSQLGYTIDELEGLSVLKLFHEDDRAAVAEQLLICLQNPNQVNRWQFRKIRKDGGLLWVEETAQAVYDLDGALNLLVVCQDVTERKRMEDALRESEERFRATFNQAAVGICHVAPDGHLLRINQKYCELVGYTEEELIALTIKEITHPDDQETSMQNYQLLLEGKLENYSLGKRYIRKDGSIVWVNLTASKVFDAGGNPIFAVGVIEDISERKLAEEALRLSEERYRRLYNDTPVMLHSIDHDMRLVSVSNYWLETLGYERNEVLGRIFTEFLTAASCSYATEVVLPGFFRTGSVKEVPYQIMKKNGEILEVQLSAIAERNSEGKVVRSLAVMVDVTERKRAEEEIERLNVSLTARAVDLEYANRELEAFNYTVAHDLRNPLNVISSYCQVIMEMCSANLGEQCMHYIQETYDGTLRMSGLIEALLDFSLLTHAELNRNRVDLSRMAKEVAAERKGTDAARRVEIRIADGIVANGDAILLRVVLANLLDNAWKYTVTREEAVLEFGVKEIGGEPVYFVRDNGSGFDNAVAEKIFAPFQRLPGTEKCRGFGIGLATVERIIRRHGGRVCAEGEPGKGATFYFTLSADGSRDALQCDSTCMGERL